MEAPAQVPHARGRSSAPPGGVGCEGSGAAAADTFFAQVDPEIASPSPPPAPPDPPAHRDAKQLPTPPDPAIMVPFGPCPTVPAGEGIPGAWLHDGLELEPAMFARAGRLRAVSMDMGPGYAKSVREHAPQAAVCVDPYHVVQVRHEALPVRVGCETPPPGCRGSPAKLRAV
jgi:Transposase